ncbi:PREDICTED: 5'-3' exoribonuclease 3-like [Tarenaya hassleriana]|nr:PREDICTED: 5'-3' exoribonuclease 3-like [Tarenaya hassleriana]
MIFMSASHPLAEVIRTLENRCKTLAGRRRRKITEKIDPELSDGLNGYLALCSGESQSPSFSSPIKGMKDILANEVICTTYKLPDQHKHVARPPAGVVFPEKMVNASDLVSKSATWHEDVVRSKRNNPPGSISGVQLREAALKLVRRSIQPRPNHTDVNSETNPSALRPTSVFQNGGDWKRVLPFPCLRLTA